MPLLPKISATFLLAALLLTLSPADVTAAAQWQGAAFKGDRAMLGKLAAAGAKTVRVYGEKDA